MKSVSRFRVVLLAFACLVVHHVSAQTPAVTPSTVRIHHVGPIAKGSAVAANKEAIDSAQAYFDKVNKSGGISGRQIELVLLDDQQDPLLTEKLGKEAVNRNEVLSFFLLRTSPAAQILQKIAEPSAIPIVAPQAGPNFMYAATQNTFYTIRASFEAELLRSIELQLKYDRKRIALLAADDAFGNPLVEAASKRLSPLNLAPTVEKVDNRAADVNPALNKFLTAKPDVIFLVCGPACATEFVKKYKEKGGAAQLVALSNNSTHAFIKGMGDAGRGVIVTQVVPLPTSKTVKVSKEYQSICTEYKIEPSHNGLLAFMAAKVTVEGLKRAGKNLSVASFRAALNTMKQFDIGDHAISFASNHLNGSDYVEETIISRDGKFVR